MGYPDQYLDDAFDKIEALTARAEKAEAALATARAEGVREGLERAAEIVPDYDAGLLNDYGGGNVEWWHDYLRAEIERAVDSCRAVIRAEAEKEGAK